MVSSWGYDQTNVDYYQVVGVTRCSVKLRKIAKTAGAGDTVTPIRGSYSNTGDALTRRFRLDTTSVTDKSTPRGKMVATYRCSITDYSSASLWDGTPDYQTPIGCGH